MIWCFMLVSVAVWVNLVVIVELIVVIFLAYWTFIRYKYKSVSLFLVSLILLLVSVILNIMDRLEVIMLIDVLGHSINLNDMLFTEFLLASLLAWSLSIHFMDYEGFTVSSIAVVAIISMAAIGELFEQHRFEMMINIFVEILGLLLFAYLIIRHFIRSMWGLRVKELRKFLAMYVAGFIFLIIMGIVSLGAQIIGPPLEYMLQDSWLLGLSTSIFLSGIMLVKYPHLLLVNISRPKKLIIATELGIPLVDVNFVMERDREIDPAFVSSALTGVSSIIKEITGKEIPLNSISIGDYIIMVSKVGKVVGYLFVERSSFLLREILDRIVENINKEYGDLFAGDIVVVDKETQEKIKRKIADLFPLVLDG